ncbi:hypothetical protein DRQ09_07560 [candidate division KSB1 bacterium]|nr:MAG: hypothetical protein DRQ09_07560 [candidate division KSB1 bacterium]
MKKVILIFVLSFIFIFSGCNQKLIQHKVLILGIDGMDPNILMKMIDEGKMPNFKKLKEEGSFSKLGTSHPPQSPVAWSNFITGMNPGGHGIFDFIHRDPKSFTPYLSTSKVEPPGKTIKIGKLIIPLSAGKVELLRKGKAFWEILEDNGIPTTVFKIPSNFPPKPKSHRSISGMGTPDILGTYGQYSFYTSNMSPEMENLTGGKVYKIQIKEDHFTSSLPGPANPFVAGNPEVKIPFDVYIDSRNMTAQINIQDENIILKKEEWSDWIRVRYKMLPLLKSITGIVRFYLKDIIPDFKLYASPINIDPSNPALPISNPGSYSKELFKKFGFFYTQGMAEDTKAYLEKILSVEEYIKQAYMVYKEREKMYYFELNRFKAGLLFFYFSSTDLNTHVFWFLRDKNHPFYNEKIRKKAGDVIEFYYKKMDGILGNTLAKIDTNTTLIIMSDHGFAPFYKKVNLNTWLLKEGYIKLYRESKPEDEFFQAVDWNETKAYALGLNAIYLNLKGRERMGIVADAVEKNLLLDEIIKKLKNLKDPENGKNVIRGVYKSSEIYSGKYLSNAPDLIVGYYKGYRTSDESALGSFSRKVIELNDGWSGDHCIDPNEVPGIFLSNKKLKINNPKLYDIAPTVLKEFNIKIPEEMIGKPIF